LVLPINVSVVRSYSLRVFVSCGVLFAFPVASFSTSDAFCPRILVTVRAFPEIAGPFHLATEVHPPMELIPYRVSYRLLAVRPVGRTDFLEILLPFNGVAWASPV
jgi:hypothetical protein